MDLLDRYLNAVKSFLPRAQQDDIVKELAANIQEQMEDHADQLGRPLTEDEQAAIIETHGHPMTVAGRYQTPRGTLVFGRQLIGPTLFPFYIKVLWLTLGLALAIHALVIVALAVVGNPTTFAGVFNEILLQFLIQFLAVTFIFAAVEWYLPTLAWNVRHLPTIKPIIKPVPQQVPRVQSIAEIVAIIVMSLWLSILYSTPHLLFGPAAAQYRLGPIWGDVALPTFALFGVGIIQAIVTLIRPTLPRFRLVMRMVSDFGLLGLTLYLTQANPWIIGANAATDPHTLSTINQYVQYGLWFTVLGAVIVIGIDGWRLLRDWRTHA